MAERSVGTISVTVDAKTNKLKAQLVAAGAEAGKATAEEIESELSNLRVSIEEIDGRQEARVLKAQMEAQLRGIEVGLDMSEATRDLRIWQRTEGATELLISAVLDGGDMRKIALQVEAMSDEERTIFFGSDADLRQVHREIAQLQAERHTTQLLADLDESEFHRKMERLAAERHEARIRAELDLTRAEAALAAFDRNRDPLQIPVEGDFSDINASMLEFRRSQSARRLDIDVGAQIASATAEMEALVAQFDGKNINLKTEADMARARATIEAFRVLQENDDIELPVGFDLNQIEAALTQARASWISQMAEAGNAAGEAGGKGLSVRMKAIIAGIVVLFEPAAVALQGLASQAVAVLSSAFSALGGAIGPMIPILGGLLGTVGALVVGFQGMGDGLGAVTEEFAAAAAEGRAFNINAENIAAAMKNLAPAAQDVVRAFADLMPQFDAIKRVVQQNLFEGIGDTLRELGDSVLPSVGRALGMAATSLNQFFKSLADVATEIDFGKLFLSVQPAVDSLLKAVVSITKAIEPFFRAAAPAAKLLAENIAEAAESLARMISAGDKSGKLARFFVEGVQSLEVWGDLIANVADALFTLFEAGKSTGDSLVQTLADIVGEFDTWMESTEGQEALLDFFSTAHQLAGALVPVIQGLGGFFDNMITPGAVARFEELGVSIGNILPVLGSLLSAVGESRVLNTLVELLDAVTSALDAVMPQIQEAAQIIGGAFLDAIESVNSTLPGLAEAFGNLATAVAPAIGDTISFIGDALELLGDVLAPVLTLISNLPGPLLTAAAAFLTFRALGGGVVRAATGIAQAFVNLKSVVSGGFGTMLASANVWALGLAAAATVAVVAWDHFTSKQRDAEAEVRTLSNALSDQVQELLGTVDATNAATLGLDALSNTLTTTGEDGEKLTKAMGVLGKTTKDSLDTIVKAAADPVNALAKIGEEAGLTTEQAEFLAEAVTKTGGSFTDFIDRINNNPLVFGENVRAEAEKLGLLGEKADEAQPKIFAVGDAMAVVNDQAQSKDLDGMIRQFLAMDAASSDTNQTLLTQAENMEGVNRSGDNLTGLYLRYTGLLAQNKVAVDNAAAAEQNAIDAKIRSEQATTELANAYVNLFEKAVAAQKTAAGWREAELAMAGLTDPIANASAAFDDLKKSAEEAETAATDLQEALDLFANPAKKAANAASDYQASLDEMAVALQGGTEAQGLREEAWAKAAEGDQAAADALNIQADALMNQARAGDVSTEAGRAALAIAEQQVDAIFAHGNAMVIQGASAGQAAQGMLEWREGAIQAGIAAGQSREQAELLINTYGATPDTIVTAFIQQDMDKAQKDVLALDADMSGLPDFIETLIATPGLSESLKAVLLYDEDLDGIPDVVDSEIKVRDEATPVVAETTQTLETYDGNTYEADIAAKDAAAPVLEAVTGDATAFAQSTFAGILGADATTFDTTMSGTIADAVAFETTGYDTQLGADRLPFDTTMQGVVADAVAFESSSHNAKVSADRTAFDTTMQGVVADAIAFENGNYEALLTAKDDASVAIAGVVADAVAYDSLVAEASVGVNGATEAKSDVGEVAEGVEGLSGKSGEANVSIIGNTVVLIQLGLIATALEVLHDVRAKPQISLPTYQVVTTQLNALRLALINLNAQTAQPRISIPTWFTAISQVGALTQAIRNIPDKTVTVRANVVGLDNVRALDTAIDNLQSKTVTVTTRNVQVGQVANMTGAIVPGAQGGELIRGPQMRLVGERGYDEAIIPLQLPLNRVDPSVRELAALLRGEGLKQTGPTKIINQYMSVTAQAADPVAVATQVVNRSALLAQL